jgi:hypothetical protein
VIAAVSAPIGAIRSWIRPDNTTPLPYGWVICDGSTIVDSMSPFNGKTIPDLRGQFSRGHATLNNSNFASDTLYYTGGTVPSGGADTNNLQHSHSTPSHNHSWSGTSGASANFGSLIYWYGQQGVYSHTHTISGSSDNQNPPTDNRLSASTENRPAFIELLALIRVK